ncbi:sugar nucleotide-binding protein [Pseudactinotalea sp. HY160]|uniref:sugar nucleotide-binding protein n=1 Tax=Pseudactinotalea sp. HY160 TaxID=2654490 RepID=UPI00128DCA47|nr:bifunctional dTDP-4-dehydrorhamnose 3,5-epimerase family protein/NAD(P)-dependent oxidoreductase [Pseudactinotalea sp. HY160]MPV48532.1 sugar nucleotide-binding protein [Pseudactinotalea sp. HY160]
MTAVDRPLTRTDTAIPGLVIVDLPVHADARGWFKENWHREKMRAAGLPDFGPVQNNISYNDLVGTTRGIHAEPWDKLVSVAAGRVFGAWVDLREGPGFGRLVTAEIDPARAVFVPRGVGNSFQTLEPGTAYTYLVNDHWSPAAEYAALDPADETVAIPWPIPLAGAAISAKDRTHPRLADVTPVSPRRILVLGSDGQLGRALRRRLGDAPRFDYADHASLDLTDPDLADARSWRDYAVIVDAAGYTDVDAAETLAGRAAAWAVNATGAGRLAQVAAANGLTLVHVSTDYVFDGAAPAPYREDAPPAPLGGYGQSKAAGDLAVAATPRHYLVRASWIIGDGHNFVATMAGLARRGDDPAVVGDQVGRLTFADDLAAAIAHLLESEAPFGTYNVTNAGTPRSWAGIAREVFRLTGHDPGRVRAVTTAEYNAARPGPTAPRPANSVLDLAKITATGFTPRDGDLALAQFLAADVLIPPKKSGRSRTRRLPRREVGTAESIDAMLDEMKGEW